MRHQSSGRRSRNRGGSGGGNSGNNGGGNRRSAQNNRSHVFDSNGPDVRIRGTAHQIHEKYMALARDAAGSGDRIVEESYLQHAEHYQRVINSWQAETVATAESDSDSNTPKVENNTSFNKEDQNDHGLSASITGVKSKKDILEDA
ncbi:MAG: hypothetical protein CO093_09635 [Alphaproteobacteria bacterium CG_4_9_14_3_um_filter_47_13]|nr:MAG: hypothetical protein CO093_09635 [Alphaproteobacteria bacterium CG_4_9_14_3_um_filter_47_13]